MWVGYRWIAVVLRKPQGPHSQILMIWGGGGCPTEVHILYPKKSQLQNLSTQRITTLFSIPKKSFSWTFNFLQPKKICLFFSMTQKILVSLVGQKNHLDTPPPLPSPSLKYASGAPGKGTHCPNVSIPSTGKFVNN